MKKARKWSSILMAAFTVLSFSACEDWGQMDPPAGNDVYPKLEQVSKITFEGEDFEPESLNYYAYTDGDVARIEEDAVQGTALHLPDGYARIANPMALTKVQNGVSLTMLVKQPLRLDAETEEPLPQDLEGALFSFQNADGTEYMYFTANGQLTYKAEGTDWEANNPSTEFKTGMLPADGEWHYLAVKVTNNGYEAYVDGMKKVEKLETYYDCSRIVQFMATAPYLYIGYGAENHTKEMWVDDLTLYRNQITAKEIADPRKPAGADETDYRTYITVGAEDNSSPWWTVFSDLIKFKQSVHFGFYNYGSGGGNWNNWVAVITNGKAVGEAGYAEYFVIRSDAWGWGQGTDVGATPGLLNITHNFNFDTFIADMQGAYVDLTFTREGDVIEMKAIITTAAGTVYNYGASFDGGNYGGLDDTLGAFFTCDSSHLLLDAESVYTEGEGHEQGTALTGATDFSTPFFGAQSPHYAIEGDTEYPFGFIFYNYGNGGGNWNNWVNVITNGIPFGGAGYLEHWVLRSDAYGWGTLYEGLNMTANFDWNTFIADMQGAYVRLFFKRKGNELTNWAVQRKADGSMLPAYSVTHSNFTEPLFGTFVTVDASYIDLLKAGYFPYADKIAQ